jgi:hypothetical protein
MEATPGAGTATLWRRLDLPGHDAGYAGLWRAEPGPG